MRLMGITGQRWVLFQGRNPSAGGLPAHQCPAAAVPGYLQLLAYKGESKITLGLCVPCVFPEGSGGGSFLLLPVPGAPGIPGSWLCSPTPHFHGQTPCPSVSTSLSSVAYKATGD